MLAAQGGVAQGGVLRVVVGQHEHVGARRHLAQDELGEHRVVHVHARHGVVEHGEAGRAELVLARVDEVQLEVVPGQDPGQLEPDVAEAEDRHRRRDRERLEQHVDLTAAALATVLGAGPVGRATR